MINLFNIASNDKSMQYLSSIFGLMNGVLWDPSGAVTSNDSILATMFKTFNAVMLTVAIIIVLYVMVVGLLKTAQEGEVMGKQWSSLWLPIRMVLGIASLIPTPVGYSSIQMIMMWVIVQGIGAADTIWTTALVKINLSGSVYAKANPPSVGNTTALSGLFQAMVCDATFRESGSIVTVTGTPVPPGYYCATTGDFCQENPFNPAATNVNTYKLGPGGACGTLTYCNQDAACSGTSTITQRDALGNENQITSYNQNSLGCLACQAQVNALAHIINEVYAPIAKQMEQTDYSYRNFYANNNPSAGSGFSSRWIGDYCTSLVGSSAPEKCCVLGPPSCESPRDIFSQYSVYNDRAIQDASKATVQNLYWPYSIKPLVGEDANFITDAARYYQGTLDGVASSYASNMATQTQGTPVFNQSTQQSGRYDYNTILANAQKTGWIFAGSFYYLISQMNNQNADQALPDFSMSTSSPPSTGDYQNYRSNFIAAGALIQAMNNAGGAGGSSSGGGAMASNPQLSGVGDAMNESFSSISTSLTTSTSSFQNGINPLVALQSTGYTLLFIVQILYPVLLVVSFFVGLMGSLSFYVLGTGVTNPLEGAMLLVYFLLIPALLGLMAILIVLGGLLGVYVPLIPYTIFTFGAIGWMLSVIEAMVAGPLVAIGIMMPSGHHEMLGKAEHGLMILFSIFLRPTLMIFGLIAGMLLAVVAVLLVNETFGMYITTMSNPQAVGNVSGSANYSQAGAAALAFNPLMLIIILCAYVMLIITVLNKCFAAIHVIPERVMTWIGAQGLQYGEEEAVGKMKAGTEAGVGGIKQAGAGAEKGVEGMVKEKKGQREQAQGKVGGKEPEK